MTLRVAAAALAGAVVIFVLAGLSFGLLFADFFAHSIPPDLADVSRKETNLALIFVSDLLYASLLAYVFAFLANIRTFRRGAMVGMVLGFTVVLHFDLISAATTRLTTLRVWRPTLPFRLSCPESAVGSSQRYWGDSVVGRHQAGHSPPHRGEGWYRDVAVGS